MAPGPRLVGQDEYERAGASERGIGHAYTELREPKLQDRGIFSRFGRRRRLHR